MNCAMNRYIPANFKPKQNGFSLVELMVAIAIGMLIVAGLTGIFVNNSQARSEIEKANRQIENGRYAMQMITEDLRLAGFYGEFDPTAITTPPVTKPDPCLTTPADLKTALPLHVQGYDNASSSTLSCLSDVRTGTDILVIRRTSTCVAGSANCDAESAGTPYFQASLCNNATELGSSSVSDFYGLDSDTGNLTRRKRDCTTLADKRRYLVHIYFIANNDKSSDGIPTLKRAELGSGGSAPSFSIVPLVEGVENLQIEYGIDSTCDATPDAYSANIDSYAPTYTAPCTAPALNWQNVISAKVNLLARNTEVSAGYTDAKTYSLGLKADGSANTVGPFNDNIKRHVYQAVVRMNNPAGRKEP